jgi:uncharacterized caspase-like protein
MKRTIVLCLVLCALVPTLFAQSGKRVALVIGNADYKFVKTLANPANDANDMAASLSDLGFSVTKLVDADLASMEKARRDFSSDAQGAQLRLFYYAGHGVQSDGINWLLPVDADVQEDYELKTKAFSAQSLLDGLVAAGAGVNLVMLDACRDNPFKAKSRSAGANRGLAVMGVSGSFVVYATGPGTTAADGSGRNGLFTECLLKRLDSPGLSLQEIMTNVAADVVAKSGGKQEPWKQDNLTKMVYFVTPDEARARFGSKIAEGEAALKAAEAELVSLRESAGREADAAKKQAIELEIKKKAALEAQRRQETEALKAEKERQEAAAKAQAEETVQLASLKSEQASRETAIRKAAEAKRKELESLRSSSGGVISYILSIESARHAQSELEKQYDDSQTTISASVSGTYDQKLAALASWAMDPWENEAEFKTRIGKERSRLSSEKNAALADALADTQALRTAALAPFEDAEQAASSGLEATRTIYKGSDIKLEVQTFDRDAKRFPVLMTLLAPELPFKVRFFYSIKNDSSEELKRLYLEFDSWMKAGALFGEIEASVLPAGEACFVNQIEAVRLRAVDSSGEKVLFKSIPMGPVSTFSSSSERAKPRSFSSYLYVTAPGAAISVNGSNAGRDRAFLADPKPGAYTIKATLPDGTAFEEKRDLSANAAERVSFTLSGSIAVSAKTTGWLWLDGKQVGWLQAGDTKKLPDLSPTSHLLEMRYSNSNSERLQLAAKAQKEVSAFFQYEAQVVCVGWAGNSASSASGGTKAMIWRGSEAIQLPADGIYKRAYAVAVSGGDMYVAGDWSVSAGGKSINRPCYWKNGSRVDLPAEVGDAKALEIAISGGTVYVCGYYTNAKGQKIPCYWAGGKRTDLAAGLVEGAALSIALSPAGTVYTAGWYATYSKTKEMVTFPCYWIGTKKTDLSTISSANSFATSITVGDGKLYIAGSYWDGSRAIPCYWEGSSRNLLPISGSSGRVNCIIVAGGIVLSAGQYYDGTHWVPCYWKNATRVDLPAGRSDAQAMTIVVEDGVVYAAGFRVENKQYTPCYWKDGKRVDLSGASADSSVQAILVQP